MRNSVVAFCAVVALAVAGCQADTPPDPVPSVSPVPSPSPSPEPDPLLSGVIRDGTTPLADVLVRFGDRTATTDERGYFEFADPAPGTAEIRVAGFERVTVDYTGGADHANVFLTRTDTMRALRVFSEVARSDSAFQNLLDTAAGTTVNALVFDTKDETHRVLYDTAVPEALELGFVADRYDPVERIAQAREAGLYTVTRIVTFEDANWADARPDLRLARSWIDPLKTEAWEYPLGLAVEACELGFDEIQFDYIRFPTGVAAREAREKRELTQDQRVAAVTDFLTEARDRLHPLGCAVSADIFGIVMTSPNDQGIGQLVEEVTVPLDAVSPMLYPSHYSSGWLGFDDPNDHPGPVIAHALDVGMPRTARGTEMRPWIQAFWYTPDQIRAQIDECEARGAGWILWHYGGVYDKAALPRAD